MIFDVSESTCMHYTESMSAVLKKQLKISTALLTVVYVRHQDHVHYDTEALRHVW